MSSPSVNLSALTKAQVVTLLKNSGSTAMTSETLERHIESGAPISEDGTMNLVNYSAWLVRENLK